MNTGNSFSPHLCLGLAALSIVAVIYEAIADFQLESFRKIKKKGQIIQHGLWKYSRHPNYFGELVFWYCLAGIAFIQGVYWSVGGPLLLTFLLLKVSGIPMTEKRYEDNLEFQTYKKRTSASIPWFPKS